MNTQRIMEVAAPLPSTIPGLDLHRIHHKIQARLVALETCLSTAQNSEAAWREYIETLDVFLRIEDRIASQRSPAPLLSTKEMAERMGISARTLLQRKKRGHIKPSIAHGKALGWRPEDATR